MAAKTPAAKKRKIVQENRVFNEDWTTKYFLLSANEKQFVSYVREMSACLRSVFFIPVNVLGFTTVSLQEFNMKQHFTTTHPKHAEMSMDEKKREVSQLCASLEWQSMMFVKKSTECAANTRASYKVSLMIARHLKPFSDGEFIKLCMLAMVDAICPEKKDLISKVSLSRQTVAWHIEEMGADVRASLRSKCLLLHYFSLALDESTDIKDTSQLSIFIRGVHVDMTTFEEFIEVFYT